MAIKTKPKKPARPVYPRVLETYDNFDYELTKATRVPNVPSVGNFDVLIRRYRITVELIDEPHEVLVERLRGLWRKTDNYHDYDKLCREAKTLHVKLDPTEFGADVKGGP
jgi:hypothetical protein